MRPIGLILIALVLVGGLLVALDIIPMSLFTGGDGGDGSDGDMLGVDDETGEAGLAGRGKEGLEADAGGGEEAGLTTEPEILSEVRGSSRNGASIRGRVVEGKAEVPAVGVIVNLIRRDSFFTYLRGKNHGRFDELTAKTDTEGRFAFVDLIPNDNYVVRVHKEPHAYASSERLDLRGGEHEDVGDLALNSGGSLTGKVLDADGNPMADVRVVVSWNVRNEIGVILADPDTLPEIEKEAVTDKSGTYVLDRLEPTAKTVIARAASGATALIRRIRVRKDEVKEAKNMQMTGSLSVAGKILWKDGTPIQGARVFAGVNENDALRTMDTGADGSFRIKFMPPGNSLIGILVQGLPVRIEYTEAGTEDLAYEFDLPGSLDGRVVQADGGQPVGEFSIRIDPVWTNDGFNEEKYAHDAIAKALGPTPFANPDGSFRFERLSPGTYNLTVKAPGFAEIVKGDVVVQVGVATTDLVIEVPTGNAANGKVLRSNGEPLAEARVYVVRELPDRMAAVNMDDFVGDMEPAAGTRGDGSFVLPAQAPGRYDLVVTHGDSLPGVLRDVDLRTGNQNGLEVRMPPSGTVSGVILGESGRPAKGESMYVLYPNALFVRAEADEQGRFKRTGLPVGSCIVRWLSMRDQRKYRAVMIAPDEEAKRAAYDELRTEGGEHYVSDGGETTVTLRLPRRVNIRGHIRVAGEPPRRTAGFWLGLSGGGGAWIECDDKGYFEREIEAGTYVLWMPDSKGNWHQDDVEIPGVATHTMDIERD